jgi:hypothetical protein
MFSGNDGYRTAHVKFYKHNWSFSETPGKGKL